MLIRLACAATFAVLVITPITQGGIQAVGDPIPGGSWGQRFVFETVGTTPIEVFAVRIAYGGPFEGPALRAFDAVGWQSVLERPSGVPTLAAARSRTNHVNRLGFEVWFDAEPSDPVAFVFAAYAPGQVQPLEAYRLSWSGQLNTAWDCVWVDEPDNGFDNPTIPAPAAAVLSGVGLGVVWVLRRSMT